MKALRLSAALAALILSASTACAGVMDFSNALGQSGGYTSQAYYHAMVGGQPMTAAQQAYADQEDQLRQLGFRSELGGDIALGQMFYRMAYGMMLPSSALASASGGKRPWPVFRRAKRPRRRLFERERWWLFLWERRWLFGRERRWLFERERRWLLRQRVNPRVRRPRPRAKLDACSPGAVDLGHDAHRFRWPRLRRLARLTKARPPLRLGRSAKSQPAAGFCLRANDG